LREAPRAARPSAPGTAGGCGAPGRRLFDRGSISPREIAEGEARLPGGRRAAGDAADRISPVKPADLSDAKSAGGRKPRRAVP
ncbi:MAG: hypothetical protein D6718_08560, partial [Acidobacteria bacterium]